MSFPRPDNLSGKPTLGRYTILREVARSNDIVYEAVDPTINRRLALKELNIAPTLSGQARRERIERFFREGRAAGAMNHANIVTIFEIGEDNGRFFIAMEFLEGQSLRDRLATVGTLPLAEAVSITAALADALSYAHERGVVHRDIKPDNVHILPGGQVKLTDFGIARILSEDQLTIVGQVFGTPSYMSPEQVTGNPLDGRTDQFSLGVLLYEMLTGHKPFTGDTVVTITYRILHEPVPVAAGVPAEIAAVMERALSKSPEHRFASVSDFRHALLAAADRARPGALPASATRAYPAPAPATRQATLYTAPPAPAYPSAPSAPTTVFAATPAPAYLPPAQTANGDTPRRSSSAGTVAVAALVLLTVLGGAGYALQAAFRNVNAGQSRTYNIKQSNDGVALYNAGKYEDAAAIFDRVRLSPTTDSATRQSAAANETVCYRMLGQQAQKDKDLANAQMWFNLALKVTPGDAQAQAELAAVQKAGGTVAVTGDTGAANSGPLGAVLQPSPAVSSALPPMPGAVESPPPPPKAATTSDFNARNAKAAADAQSLLAQGDAAFQNSQRDSAADLWRQAVAAGPGSPSAIAAQDRLSKFASGTP